MSTPSVRPIYLGPNPGSCAAGLLTCGSLASCCLPGCPVACSHAASPLTVAGAVTVLAPIWVVRTVFPVRPLGRLASRHHETCHVLILVKACSAKPSNATRTFSTCDLAKSGSSRILNERSIRKCRRSAMNAMTRSAGRSTTCRRSPRRLAALDLFQQGTVRDRDSKNCSAVTGRSLVMSAMYRSPATGSVFDIVGERAVIVRGKDGIVRAFHNVCRHRGSRVVAGDKGHCKSAMVCPFHGWSYNLDGTLAGGAEGQDLSQARSHAAWPRAA